MLQPYPTEIIDAAKIMLRKVKGEDVPMAEAVHACYQVLGVGLGQLLPDGPVVMSSGKKKKGGKTAAAPLPESKPDDWDRPDGMKCPVPAGAEATDVLEKTIECAEEASTAEHGVGASDGFLDSYLMKQLVALAVKMLSDFLVKQ